MHDDDAIPNPSAQPSFGEVCAQRRALLKGSTAALVLAGIPFAGCATMPAGTTASAKPAAPGFKPVAVSTADTVVVPEGYDWYVLYAWGDPISNGPAFKQDASNTAAEQALQAGMHHDAVHFFPMVASGAGGNTLSSEHGLLVINHEYTDDGLLHPDGMKTWTAAKVQKAQAAMGVSVIVPRISAGTAAWGSASARLRAARRRQPHRSC